MDSTGLGQEPMAGSREHGYELLGSIKARKFLTQFSKSHCHLTVTPIHGVTPNMRGLRPPPVYSLGLHASGMLVCATSQKREDLYLKLWLNDIQTVRHHISLSRSEPKHPKYVQKLLSYYLVYILILSSYLRLGLTCNLFNSGFLSKTLHAFLFSLIRVTYPTHLILLALIALTIQCGAKRLTFQCYWSQQISLF